MHISNVAKHVRISFHVSDGMAVVTIGRILVSVIVKAQKMIRRTGLVCSIQFEILQICLVCLGN